MILLYFVIAFIATLFGSLVGLGGGVIVKPALDILNQFDAATISALSSTTIFAMTIVSLSVNLKNGITIDKGLWWLAGGGVIGGYLGKMLFGYYLLAVGSDAVAKGIQAILLGLVMLLVLYLISRTFEPMRLSRPSTRILLGVVLGAISSFLGIGGGPLNVIFIAIFCGVDKKYAAFGSVFLIFASQGTKVLALLAQGQFHLFNLSALMGLIPGAIIGGYLGSLLYRRLSAEVIVNVFRIAIIILAIVNFAVAYRFLS